MSDHSTVTIAGEIVTIRPIRLTDVAMEKEFIHRLSAETKHFRFLAAVRELPAQDLARFCDVDVKHSMAFVATVRHDGREVEIGVSRYAPNSRCDVREVAVTIADEWQHKGLGASLMNQLIQTARVQGIKQLYSVDACQRAGNEFDSRPRRFASDHPLAHVVDRNSASAEAARGRDLSRAAARPASRSLRAA
jgi:N-acetylglutamate synthase-like GNAT family acetyltransferase